MVGTNGHWSWGDDTAAAVISHQHDTDAWETVGSVSWQSSFAAVVLACVCSCVLLVRFGDVVGLRQGAARAPVAVVGDFPSEFLDLVVRIVWLPTLVRGSFRLVSVGLWAVGGPVLLLSWRPNTVEEPQVCTVGLLA